jgi:ankyrin repeat protein
MEYIDSLHYLSQDIYKLPKLSKEDIYLKTISNIEKLFLFAFYEHYDVLDKFDIKELNYSGIYNYYKNILMIAAYYNKIRLIKYLLARGIDINNESGQNAYLFACININVKIKVLKLLETTNYYTRNPFIIYMYNCQSYPKIRILEYFKSIGINIYKVNTDWKNSYFYADSLKLIKYLETNGINIHFNNNMNIYSYIIRNNDPYLPMTLRILKYYIYRGVNNYYSDNYSFCKKLQYYNIIKHLLISNSNNRYKTIVCYI